MSSSGQQLRLVRYRDTVEGFSGYLAYAGEEHRLAAGGCRVMPGLEERTIMALAETMTLKQRLLGLAVDGAKAGIAYDPRSPGKREALRRFVRFLRPHLLERFSMGPDRGTTWRELEDVAAEEGLASVKVAIARAQQLDEADFRQRIAILDVEVNGLTVGQRRAGHALAHAALAVCEAAATSRRPLLASIQGFGNLGRGTALALAEAGVVITSASDEYGSVNDEDGLDVGALLSTPLSAGLAENAGPATSVGPREAPLAAPVDVVVLAACEDAITLAQARSLPASAVVVGANLGLGPASESLLHRRRIPVVPDFVAGCGGSASMDALFGPPRCPSALEVLEGTAGKMRQLVHQILDRSQSGAVTPRSAALALSKARAIDSETKPYGHSRAPHPAEILVP